MDLPLYLREKVRLVDEALDRFLPAARVKPTTIHQAMRYSIFAGGKRLRPVLVLAAAEACGGIEENAIPAACAVECIHTYSLIHDDLPCMDDDDLRRGRPTCHKVFGDAIAVLAGDALLTLAFELLTKTPPHPRYSTAHLVRELAQSAGSRALIAGQVMDLESEGKAISVRNLQFIHRSKTAALLSSSLRLGAMCANATPKKLVSLTQFGESIGLAFQVIDDILDVTQTTEKLGKTAGKDIEATKATYPSILGLDKSRRVAASLTQKARSALEPFGRKGEILHALADMLVGRDH
jgi:geranylgeranyl diphosphate synthase type II